MNTMPATTQNHRRNAPAKGAPVPTRFLEEEDRFLHEAAAATGFSVSELVRRSVRLLKRQHAVLNSFGFVTDLVR